MARYLNTLLRYLRATEPNGLLIWKLTNGLGINLLPQTMSIVHQIEVLYIYIPTISHDTLAISHHSIALSDQ